MHTDPSFASRFAMPAFVLASSLVAGNHALGQELVTDRPDQTESSITVPAGRWQIETGWTWARDDQDGERFETNEGPGTLLRVGVSTRWELRLGWAGWIREEVSGGGQDSVVDGFTDGELGAKVYLREERGAFPEIALLFGTSVPVGENSLTSDHFDPSFRFSLSHTLSDRLSLGYNLGMEWETSDSAGGEHTLSRGIYTVALGIGLDNRAGVFVELFGSVAASAEGSPEHSIDGGFTWLLKEDIQLDIAGGFGLSEAAGDWFLGVGLSVRLPGKGTTSCEQAKTSSAQSSSRSLGMGWTRRSRIVRGWRCQDTHRR